MTPVKRWLFIGLIGLVLVGIIGWVGFTMLKPHTFSGEVVSEPAPAYDFSFLDANGDAVRLSDFKGKLILLFFGYTLCPDMSPATLVEVKRALKELGADAERVQMIIISVDPERDSPALIADYAAAYDPRFIGLTGTPEGIAEVAENFNIIYRKHAGSDATGYLIDHTATLTLVDQDGMVKEIFPFGAQGKQIAADLKYWLRQDK
jgi:protein SCO1/2